MQNNSYLNFRENLELLLKGKSYSELAIYLGVPSSSLKSWINGSRCPTLRNIDKLANRIGCYSSDLLNSKVEDVLLFDDIEELKESMICKQFDGKYLSEMIRKLKKYNTDLFSGIDYSALMEMIERRNIHLHSKGCADLKYCTSFNIYKFNVGDYIYIDSEYLFTKVFNTLSQFATNIEKTLNAENM